ncbi:hypothetical protein IFR05_004166 [Cadophora sp. M221]|nr:hypothetical protein IFR05_004166 [Cadophora sp. M221]
MAPPAHIWDSKKLEDAPAVIQEFCHNCKEKWIKFHEADGNLIKNVLDVLDHYKTLIKLKFNNYNEHEELLEDLRRHVARVKAEADPEGLEAELSSRIAGASTKGRDNNKRNTSEANVEDLSDIDDVVNTLQKVTLALKTQSNSIASVKKEKIELKAKLEAAESTIQKQDADIVAQRIEISQNRNIISQQNKMIAKKDTRFHEQAQKIRENESTIAEKNKTITEANHASAKKDEIITKAKDKIVEQGKAIAKNEKDIVEAKAVIKERDTMIGIFKQKIINSVPEIINKSSSMSGANGINPSGNPIANKLDGGASQNPFSDPGPGKGNIDASPANAPGSNTKTITAEVTQSKVTPAVGKGNAKTNAIQPRMTVTQMMVQTADQADAELAEGGASKKRKVHPTDPATPESSSSDPWQVMAKNAYDFVCSMHPDKPLDFMDMIRVYMTFVRSNNGLSGKHQWQDCAEYTCLRSLLIDKTKEIAICDDKCAKCLEERIRSMVQRSVKAL